jgi:hypothetical protein
MIEFQLHRRTVNTKLSKIYVELTQTKAGFAETSLELCLKAVAAVRTKPRHPVFVSLTGPLITCRAVVYGLMSGANKN